MAQKKIRASLAATEGLDTAQFFGTVGWPEIIGTMNVVEDLDYAGHPPGIIVGVMGWAPPLPPPPPPSSRGALGKQIEWAILNLWPAGIPETHRAEDRNTAIRGLLRNHGYRLANSAEAFERAIQRVLTKLRSR
jgi:hypothetical protein